MAQNENGVTFASPLDAALRYAEIGWPVFPCGPDKKPLIRKDDGGSGFHDATTDVAQIAAWWSKWPKAQVGIATGAAGLCVIDLDKKPSEQKDGVESFSRLRDENGPYGCGLVASTPRGGRHYVYLMPDPPVSCAADIIKGSGIDVRAEGGYVVAPCGIEGREWIGGDPFDVGVDGSSNLCPMPSWVLDLVRGGRRSAAGEAAGIDTDGALPLRPEQAAAIRRALSYVDNDPRDIWIRIGMALKSTGCGQAAYDLWVEWSQSSPKFDPKDQDYQWRSIREYRIDGTEIAIGTLFHLARMGGYVPTTEDEIVVEGAPVPPPAPPPMPKRAFPDELFNCPGLVGEIAGWMVDSSTRQQKAMCLASTICMLGAVLGRRVATPTDLRTNVYALGIGETACGKDPGVKLPHLLLTRAGLGKFVGPGEWKSDSGLRAALQDAPSHVCCIDEFTKLLDMMSGKQVPGHVKGIKKYLLDMWAASNSVHLSAAYANRQLNKPVVIEQPNLCVYGVGVPAELFSSLDRGAVADGFLNRMLIVFADEQQPPRRRVGRAEPPEDLVGRLVDLEKRVALGELERSDACPVAAMVPMSPEAEAMMEQINDDADARIAALRSAGDPLSDLWVRLGAHVAKLALIKCVSDYGRSGDWKIQVYDIEWAHKFVVWCLERTMAEAATRVADSQTEAQTQRVLRIITAAGPGGITSSTLSRATQWLRRSEKKDAIQTLIDSGQVVSSTVETTRPQGGGTPLTTYVATSLMVQTEAGT